jgi:steroid delta-isomerase-like uncharacterized protein
MNGIGREIAEKLVCTIESRDADALEELFAEDAVLHHPLSPEPMRGKAAIGTSEQALFDAFSEIDVELLRVVADADDVAIELMIRARNTGALDVGAGESVPATGRRIELPAVWMLTLGTDGKIVEERDYLDSSSLFHQLGLTDET